MGKYAFSARSFLKTADFAAKYGFVCITALVLREDFQQAIEIMRTLTGDVQGAGVTDLNPNPNTHW